MLWAGFWDGGEEGRTTQQALNDFASMVDADILHPSTLLGGLTGNNKDLIGCKEDPAAWKPCFTSGFYTMYDKGLIQNFWITASEAFVKGMSQENQASIVWYLKKGFSELDERRLQNSIFWKYELRSVAFSIITFT